MLTAVSDLPADVARPGAGSMSVALEAYLARLYLDAQARRAFLDNPRAAARGAGLVEPDVSALARMDLAGLEMAADSLARKRAAAGAAQNVPRPAGLRLDHLRRPAVLPRLARLRRAATRLQVAIRALRGI